MNINISHCLRLLTFCFVFLAPINAIACINNSDKCVQISVQDKTGKAISDIVVYLQPLAGQKVVRTTNIVTISQQDQAFSPYITVSQKGNEVNFVNKDNITHHIYSAGGDESFAFKIKAGTEHRSETFEHETEIAMGCNIHDWMSGSLLIVDTPYFNKTDINGIAEFSLQELGKYQIILWHPQLPEKNNRLIEEQNITANFQFNFILQNDLKTIPVQANDDDFDFVSDY